MNMRKYSAISEDTTIVDTYLTNEAQLKSRQLLDSRKALYDGIDFKPSMSIGITSNVFQLSQEQQICYVSGNQYCLASSIDAQNMSFQYLPCNTIVNSKTKMIQIQKNKKISMVASLSVIDSLSGQINKINYFSRRDQAHRDISISARGQPISFGIFSDGKVGFFVLNQSNDIVNKFIVFFLNVERQSIITKLDKSHKAIKTISSSLGDYHLILCPTICYQIQIDLTHDAELVQFSVKQFLNEGQQYIEGCFVKSSFNLILLTNRYHALIFDNHKLVTKHELIPLNIKEPLITNLQSGLSQIIVQLNHKQLSIFNLRNKKLEFEGSIQFLQKIDQQFKILDFKAIRRQIYILIQKKNVEMWRISILSKGQQNIQILAPNISILNYQSPPIINMIMNPINLKQMVTLHSDGIFRVWSLQKGLKGSKNFFEHVYCMSIHPLGHELFAGFKQYGRIYSLVGCQLQIKLTLKIRGLTACQYTSNGRFMLLFEGNTVYQLNAYSYQTIRSFNIHLNNISELNLINNIFFISTDHYLDLYSLKGTKIFEKRFQCYFVNTEWFLTYQGDYLQIYNLNNLDFESHNKIFVKQALEVNQKITVIKLVQMLGMILLGTSKGNLIQYMWPLPKQNEQDFYKIRAAQSSIIHMIIHQTHQQLTIVTEKSIIINLQFIQLFAGQKSTSIYSILQRQSFGSKKSIMNRQYLFKGFQIESKTIQSQRSKQVMQLQFYSQNFINDIEQKRVKIKQNMIQSLDAQKEMGERQCKIVENEVNLFKSQWITKIEQLKKEINSNKSIFQKKRQQLIDEYQQKLLIIIKTDKVLRKRKENETLRLTNIIDDLKYKQEIIGANLFQQRQTKYKQLYNRLINISESLQSDRQKAKLIQQQIQSQQIELQNSIFGQLNAQLQIEESKGRGLNINMSKMKQQLYILNLRSKQLQNVTDEIQKQVRQLEQIKEQYETKKHQMQEQLQDKQLAINEKQQQLKKIFTENRNKKNLKDIHEYLMAEYQRQIDPGEMKRNQLLGKVKMMNQQLIHENKWKDEIKKQLKEAQQKITSLKNRKQQLYYSNIDLGNKLTKLGYSVTSTMKKEPTQWIQQFKSIWQSIKLNSQQQLINQNEQKKKLSHKMISKAIVNKQQTHRKIIQSEKASLWQEKHKQGLYKKITTQNIQLVKEHNLLQIEKKHLSEHVQLLKTQISLVQESQGVVLRKKSSSLAILSHNKSSLKLTPFQKYTNQQDDTRRKFSTMQKPLSTTRLKPIVNSPSWMKTIVNDIIKSKSNATTKIIQNKVSSFTNPQRSKMRKIISIHSNQSNIDKVDQTLKLFDNITIDVKQKLKSGRQRIISARK